MQETFRTIFQRVIKIITILRSRQLLKVFNKFLPRGFICWYRLGAYFIDIFPEFGWISVACSKSFITKPCLFHLLTRPILSAFISQVIPILLGTHSFSSFYSNGSHSAILSVNRVLKLCLFLYPVHGANLTLIRPMWSAYPYAPTSLYGIHMPLLPYLVIQPIVQGVALLWAAIDSALSQGPLLWRHNDMTVIVSRNTRGRERDTRQRLDNANTRRLQTVNR